MSLLRGLIERAVILVFGTVFGILVLGKILLDAVRLGPATVFGGKKRNKPPACLEDPSLGTHGYAYLENIRMHYVSNGADDKPLMLLVHGFPEFWYSWRYQLREFKDNYRVVAVDMRGYGDTDKPSGANNYKASDYVDDLKQVIAAVGYTECVLVGHDWGGLMSWVFAEKYPHMVSRLITLNCPNSYAFQRHARKNISQLKKSWYVFFNQLPWLPELAMSVMDFAYLDSMMKSEKTGIKSEFTTADDMEAYKYNYTRNSFTGPINFYRAAFSLARLSGDRSKEDSVSQIITVPTLIVWGDRESFLDLQLAKLSSEVCKGKVEVKFIEGASHWVHMDRPDLVNKHIREFLTEE